MTQQRSLSLRFYILMLRYLKRLCNDKALGRENDRLQSDIGSYVADEMNEAYLPAPEPSPS